MSHELHSGLDWAGLSVLDIDECYDRLGQARVGRLGFIDRGEPVILPVNFAVDGRALVFRTGHGSKLASAIMEQPACLEVDSWDFLEHTGWSVLAKGMAEEVLDAAPIARFEALPVRPWASPALRNHWVRIRVEEVSGREILPPSPRD